MIEANRRNWDERAAIHRRDSTGFYRADAFLAGTDTLLPIEAAEIGDVAGKRLLHLQCHIGLDTLSLGRRGARVTGLDFSPAAIEAAREFAAKSGISARFIESDVYDAPVAIPERFDIVYTTWGTITWLPDVYRWTRTIAALLADRGKLYFLDTHPQVLTLEEENGALVSRNPWRTPAGAPLICEGSVTYTGDPAPLSSRVTYQWIHPLSEILNALIEAGLAIRWVHEHDLLPHRQFRMMIEAQDRMYRLPDEHPPTPLSVSMEAGAGVEPRWYLA